MSRCFYLLCCFVFIRLPVLLISFFLDDVMYLPMWFLKYIGAFFSLVVYFRGVYAITGHYV